MQTFLLALIPGIGLIARGRTGIGVFHFFVFALLTNAIFLSRLIPWFFPNRFVPLLFGLSLAFLWIDSFRRFRKCPAPARRALPLRR